MKEMKSLRKNISSPTTFSSFSQREQLLFEFFENFESLHTKKAYERDVFEFLQFLKEQQMVGDFSQVERFHVLSYKNWLIDNDRAPKTINRKLAGNSSFFAFLVEKNIAPFNPFDCVRRPKQVVRKETQDLSDEQTELILTLAQDHTRKDYSPLHEAIIFTLFTTGIRKGELIELKRKDFQIDLKTRLATIKIRAKGGKHLEKILHPVCREKIENYLFWMQKQGRQVHREDWLFQPSKNPLHHRQTVESLTKPMNPKSIDYIMQKFCKKAGLPQHISVHSTRATYIGSAIDGGMDLYKIARDVGHSSVKTTEHYNKRRKRVEDSAIFHLGYLKKKCS